MAGGRKPTPIIYLDNASNRRTKSEIEAREENESHLDKLTTKPPAQLSKGAKKEWRRVMALYQQLSHAVINDLDLSLLACYCESVDVYTKAEIEAQKYPVMIEGKDGTLRENPYYKTMRKEGLNIAKYAELLCLSPVGRARMGVAAAKRQKEADDPMAALLARGKSG